MALIKIPIINEVKIDASQVGDVVESMLTETQFQAIRGSNWVLMDGRNVAGTTYANITGNSTIPDARGVALRGKNNGRSNSTGNQSGDLALGTYQADEFESHDHIMNGEYFNSTGAAAGNQYNNPSKVSGGAGATNFTFNRNAMESEGGNETRMRNITVNIFIKVD